MNEPQKSAEQRLVMLSDRFGRATPETRQLVARFVAEIESRFGLFPAPSVSRGDEELYFGYDPNFLLIEYRLKKPGFRLAASISEEELRASGVPAAIIRPGRPPYSRIDVTDDLRAGANEIEIRVTNTLINILEGVKHPSGLFGPPRLSFEHRYEIEVPELAPAGGNGAEVGQ